MSQETSEFTENIEVAITNENSETCRYCLEILDCEQGNILNPCECKSLVHKKCFIHWLRTRPFNPLFDMDGLMICEICKKRYNRSVKKYVNKANKERNVVIRRREPPAESNNCLFFIFLFFIILIIFSSNNNNIKNRGNHYHYNNETHY